jgi:hypothetical protein
MLSSVSFGGGHEGQLVRGVIIVLSILPEEISLPT